LAVFNFALWQPVQKVSKNAVRPSGVFSLAKVSGLAEKADAGRAWVVEGFAAAVEGVDGDAASAKAV
jgi:hypothetical protein